MKKEDERKYAEQLIEGKKFIDEILQKETESLMYLKSTSSTLKSNILENEATIDRISEELDSSDDMFSVRKPSNKLREELQDYEDETANYNKELAKVSELITEKSDSVVKLESINNVINEIIKNMSEDIEKENEPDQSKFIYDEFGNQITAQIANSIFKVQIKERKRVNRILHDQLIQDIVYLSHKTELASKYIDNDIVRTKEELKIINSELKKDIDEIRRTYYLINPFNPEDDILKKLSSRVDALRAKYDGEIVFQMNIKNEIPYSYRICLYRVALELLNNAYLHSHAKRITMELYEDNENYVIEVVDNGIGFDRSIKKTEEYGLDIVEDRVQSLNGKLFIKSKVNNDTSGTIAKAVVPKSVQEKE